VEDDIDIDGDEDAIYGDVQFTEGDILGIDAVVPLDEIRGNDAGDDERDKQEKTLQDLVAEGKILKRNNGPDEQVKETLDEVMGVAETEAVDREIALARGSGSMGSLVRALESKVDLLVSTTFFHY